MDSPTEQDIDYVTDDVMVAIAWELSKNDIEFAHLHDKVRPAIRKLVKSIIEDDVG